MDSDNQEERKYLLSLANIIEAIKDKIDKRDENNVLELPINFALWGGDYLHELHIRDKEYFNYDDQPVSFQERYTEMFWQEELRAIKYLGKKGIISDIETNNKTEDIFETGRPMKVPQAYRFVVDPAHFRKETDKILDYADSFVMKEASLYFEDANVPTVTIDNQDYPVGVMKATSSSTEVLLFCLEKHPNSYVTKKTLKEELGLTLQNGLKEMLRNSFFDQNRGPLKRFVKATAKQIKVMPTILITKSQTRAIIEYSKTHHKS